MENNYKGMKIMVYRFQVQGIAQVSDTTVLTILVRAKQSERPKNTNHLLFVKRRVMWQREINSSI